MSTLATRLRESRLRPAALGERLIAAVPLASIYLWLCIVYAVEAVKHATPWLFTDELELTQLSRSIAATGQPARRGEPHSFHSLYTVFTAPVWLIENVSTAYAGVKYLDVFVMASVVFPTYFLARMVVRRPWALFAAAGAAAIPSLAYSSWIVEETFAYPCAALCFFLIAKALLVRTRGWIVAATTASVLAPAVRGELVVILIVAVLAWLFTFWSSDWGRARRASWSWGDWLGTGTLVAGAIIVVSGIATRHWIEWETVTSYNWTKKRAFVYGDWAAGSLAIGLGVVPLVAGLASLVPARGEHRSRELSIVRSVIFAGVVGFGLYTAMKAAYLTMIFATRVEERNLIYISPLLFVGMAIVLDRRRINLFALGAAAAYALYLVVGTPFQMNVQLYSDALGLAILQQANRYLEWTPTTAQWLLIAVLAVGALGLAVLSRLGARAGTALAFVLAVGVLGWSFVGEISAAAGTVSISRDETPTLGRPFTWVDDVARERPTIYLAQGVGDQNPEWLLEFWNRSITAVTSLDATIGGPGPAGAPNLTRTGELYWTLDPRDPGRLFDYAVEDPPCVDFAGTIKARHLYRGGASKLREWRLIQLTKPNRLRAMCTGIYPDGWTTPSDSTYFRFVVRKPGWLRIRISRQSWPATSAHIQIGTIGIEHRQPVLARVLHETKVRVPSGKGVVEWIRAPAHSFTVRVVIDTKFSPREIDPRISDPRLLGAQLDYRYFTKLPRYAKPHTGA